MCKIGMDNLLPWDDTVTQKALKQNNVSLYQIRNRSEVDHSKKRLTEFFIATAVCYITVFYNNKYDEKGIPEV